MKRQSKKLIIITVSAAIFLTAGGALYVISNAGYGARYENMTPDGSMLDESGVKIVDDGLKTDPITDTGKNGWVNENGTWYYYEAGIAAKSKWLDLDGKWYYVTESGSMVKDSWKEIDGKSYYFGIDGAMYINTTTPDGKKVNSDGELILVNNTLTAEEKSVILTIIAEEIRWKRPSYITHNYIDKSEFTLEHVRNAFYQFGSKYGIADYHDWVLDREKVNSIVTSFYGVNPNFENGNSYNWVEKDLKGVTKIDSGYKMLSVDDNEIIFWDFADGDTWSEADIVDYIFEDGYLIIKGLYTEDSNGGSVISDVPFTAKFKANENNSFRFALESIEY